VLLGERGPSLVEAAGNTAQNTCCAQQKEDVDERRLRIYNCKGYKAGGTSQESDRVEETVLGHVRYGGDAIGCSSAGEFDYELDEGWHGCHYSSLGGREMENVFEVHRIVEEHEVHCGKVAHSPQPH
ncbi:hypothetical protein PMAYCL1PPCAC_08778, partial [Pristionchus mayeri]